MNNAAPVLTRPRQSPRQSLRTGRICLSTATLFLACAGTVTATAQTTAQADARDAAAIYRRDVQDCLSGATSQDQATCMTEARNTQAARKRGLLDNGNGDFQGNAMARCQALKGDDNMACQDRMQGGGKVTGSVSGGGLLREIETVVKDRPTP